MPLSRQHRHAVLLAERTRDISIITTVVTEVLAANPETSLLDIETALRHADRQSSLANITEALAANPETSLSISKPRSAPPPAKRTWWPTAPQPVSRLCSVRRAGTPRSLMPV